MTLEFINIVVVFILSIFFTGILIPQILLISFRRNLFDEPDERKIHRGVVPRLGGFAFVPVICFSIMLLFGINYLAYDDIMRLMGYDVAGNNIMLEQAGRYILPLVFGFCSLLMLYLIGIADDLIGIRYRAKFIVQILCSVLMIVGGVWIDNLYGVLGIHALPKVVGYPLTILVIVFFINAINLIDGIDGLASGLSSVALLIYGIFFAVEGNYIYSMIAFSTLGVLVPFFYYNVFGNAERHSKIFMGDTGSLTIGMIICILSIELLDYGQIANVPNRIFAMAFSPMIIPCFDVVRVFFTRLRHHRNPFMPDKSHIHHRLLALGMPQWAALITILVLSMAYTGFNILLSPYMDLTLLMMLDIAIWIAASLIIHRMLQSKNIESKNKIS